MSSGERQTVPRATARQASFFKKNFTDGLIFQIW